MPRDDGSSSGFYKAQGNGQGGYNGQGGKAKKRCSFF